MVEGEPRSWRRRQLLLAGLGAWGPATVLASSPARAEPVARPANREVVFYAPHPDDETLSMCVLIANHVRVGRKVHVVLLSDGRTSGALAAVNARLAAEHLPGLTLAQFGAARVREFRAACARLGVPAANVHHENLPGLLTVASTTPVFTAYHSQYSECEALHDVVDRAFQIDHRQTPRGVSQAQPGGPSRLLRTPTRSSAGCPLGATPWF